MMVHGAWTYGSMKADGGDFVTGGNLGWMNFPPVDGGKGDPTDTVGNPAQYVSISSKASKEDQDDGQEVADHDRCSTTTEVNQAWIDIGNVPGGQAPRTTSGGRLRRERQGLAAASSTTPRANASVFAQSWDQALPPAQAHAAARQHRRALRAEHQSRSSSPTT